MRQKRYLSWMIMITTLVVDFLYFVARSAFASRSAIGLDGFHTFLLLVFSITLVSLVIDTDDRAPLNPMRLLGRCLVTLVSLLILLSIIQVVNFPAFETSAHTVRPGTFTNVLTSFFMGTSALAAALILGLSLTTLVFVKRRGTTRRNYLLLLALIATQIIVEYSAGVTGSQDSNIIKVVEVLLIILVIGLALINAFRFSWVVMLSRKEKLFGLALTVFSLVFSITLSILSGDDNGYFHTANSYFSIASYVVTRNVFLFSAIYMLVATTSIIIHIPTAKEFDQRKNEVTSLQTMSRLINEVLDYRELLGTSAQLALDVAEAQASWIVIRTEALGPFSTDDVVALPHGSHLLIQSLNRVSDHTVIEMYGIALARLDRGLESEGQPRFIHSLTQELRLSASERKSLPYHSFAFLPLRDHSGALGTLCLAKREEFGFDQELIPALASFSDLVTIAVENSRLIEESFEKERMGRELLVARQMQQKLLPQSLPKSPCYDLSATSLPAYEVGGDYYDLLEFDSTRLGIVIADVSGKGVSAALYMAQVKGIFQSLARHEPDPELLLISMNDILCKNLERKYFVSLLYGVLDCQKRVFQFARAGHPPVIHVSDGVAKEVRPGGMALGLDAGAHFGNVLEVRSISLKPRDTLIFYTDGISEAHNAAGDEFGLEGLIETVGTRTFDTAESVTRTITTAVRSFAGTTALEDDSTLVVIQWLG